MIKRLTIAFTALLFVVNSGTAQFLPHTMTTDEWHMLPLEGHSNTRGITTPPTQPVRTAAEWEEIDGLCIRWEGNQFRPLLRDIVRYAKEECTVYILTENENSVTNYLANGGVNTTNVVFVDAESNSIWMRDYGQWNVYENDVEDLAFVDWIYNRPRPDDDVFPQVLSDLLGIPLYETTVAPTDLVNTGGNFMVDGFGTGFASELILEENEPGNPYGVSAKTENQIDDIMDDFMGLNRYIKMPTLPYDGIHHIDMHMKLLDEETILMGEYPTGVADGPQIEANLDYVVNNFNSVFGTPYKVVRIPMPPENGQYPNTWGDYWTYTNSVFINGTVLVPFYTEEFDTTAQRIYEEALPGYKIRGINCIDIIQLSGAIHCITKAVMSDDPLLISHQPLEDTYYVELDYQVNALIDHADGILSGEIYYTTDTTSGYSSVPMTLTDPVNNTWTGFIPYQQGGEEVFYYIHAEANNGKQQVRPLVAPEGYWNFDVLNLTDIAENDELDLRIYPNPATEIVQVSLPQDWRSTNVLILDVSGKVQAQSGQTTETTVSIDISELSSGMYLITAESESGRVTRPLMIE